MVGQFGSGVKLDRRYDLVNIYYNTVGHKVPLQSKPTFDGYGYAKPWAKDAITRGSSQIVGKPGCKIHAQTGSRRVSTSGKALLVRARVIFRVT